MSTIVSTLGLIPISPTQGGTGVANNAASTITVSGNFGTTFTVTGTTNLTLPTSGTLSAKDTNSNSSANNFIQGYATTATAAGTTTLTVASAEQQYFTGTTTQIVLLPVVSTLVLGQSFQIVNNSTGVVTIQSSGGNTIMPLQGGSQLTVTVIAITGTGTSSWSWDYINQVQRPIVTQSGTSVTLALTDANAFELMTAATAVTVTLPLNASVAFPIGTEIDFVQQGAGQLIFAATGGVTIQSAFSNLKVATQYGGASLKKVGTDTWSLVGNLSA